MIKLTAAATLLVALPVTALSACDAKQNPSTQPATTPAVGSGSPSSAETTSPSAGGEALAAQLKTPDGRQVATATFDFSNGYVTVTVKTVAAGILAPGFHGMHIHAIGKCEPNSVAPTGRCTRQLLVRRRSLPGTWTYRHAGKRRSDVS